MSTTRTRITSPDAPATDKATKPAGAQTNALNDRWRISKGIPAHSGERDRNPIAGPVMGGWEGGAMGSPWVLVTISSAQVSGRDELA